MNNSFCELRADEIEINIGSLIKHCLKKIKFILLIGCILAIVLPLLYFGKDSRAYNVSINENKEQDLTTDELYEIEQYNVYKERLIELEKHKKSSIILDMNCNNSVKISLEYYIDIEESNGNDISVAYVNYIENGGLAQALADVYENIGPEYIQELYWVEYDDVEKNNFITLNVIGNSEKDCNKMIEAINLELNAHSKELQKYVEEHKIECVQKVITDGFVDEVYVAQINYYNDYKIVAAELEKFEAAFNDVQKAIVSDETAKIDKVEKPKINLIYAIVGLVIGICSSTLVVGVQYIFNGKIKSDRELNKRFGYRCLGEIRYNPNSFINRISNKKIYTIEEQLENVASKIQSRLRDININKIVLIGERSQQVDKYMAELIVILSKNNISAERLENIIEGTNSYEELKKYEYAIYVEEIGIKKVKDLYEEYDIIKEAEVKIVGYISIGE